jgi:hypothetical protein
VDRLVPQPQPVRHQAGAEVASGATATTTRSTSRSRSIEVMMRDPPSTSTQRIPSASSRASPSPRSTPSGADRTTSTFAPCRRSTARRSGPDRSEVSTTVAALSPKTCASGGTRSPESTTTRMGEAPGTIRTVSWGSSASTVPAPTSTASQAARMAWATRRSCGPLIHLESPPSVAIRPSSVWAYLSTT